MARMSVVAKIAVESIKRRFENHDISRRERDQLIAEVERKDRHHSL